MPVFPSSEWIDAFCAELAGHPRAAQAATNLGGVYRFVVEPAGPLHDRRTYEVLLDARDGRAHAEQVTGTPSPRVAVRTDYGRWRQLLEARLDLGPALLFGRLRLTGDMAALMRSRDDVDVVVDALRRVDTTWLDDRS
ncbi:MAG: SCP2 sterol-binding domain-containing protein [Actinobacteria bacterium]|nr:SCP2 sterol-binding domain-containing protein [Actinomycetota bacterium]